MTAGTETRTAILYIFGGEKAQGAEIVIERLIAANAHLYNTHLILSPGAYATDLLSAGKPYKITILPSLKKLNRTFTSKTTFYTKALTNYFTVSYHVCQYIKKHNIKVVHCNTLVPSAYVAPAVLWSRLFNPEIKWLWSDHDMRYFTKLENLLAKRCFKFYDRTLVVSAALKRKYNSKSTKLMVLYNGLNAFDFKVDGALRDVFRIKHSFATDDLLIGIAGSINPDKGQLRLIEVFKKLTASNHNLKLVIAGTYASQFPEHITLVQQAIEEEPHVLNVGFIKDTSEFYNGCDIIVNNSNNDRSESLGTTIYEAMACEKVVIAANTGGTPEIITDNVDGLLFTPENQEQLLNRLVYAIGHYNELGYMRLAARQKAVSKFNITTMAAEYNRIIDAL